MIKMNKRIGLGLLFILLIFVSVVFLAFGFSRTSFFPKKSKSIPQPQPIPTKKPTSWTLLLTGDIIPARDVNYQMVVRNDFTWPLKEISPVLKEADLTFINLESPLIQNCQPTTEGMTFCGDQRFLQALLQSGVDVVTLANNHSLNYGWEGLAETEALLTQAGIKTTGFTNEVQDQNQSKFAVKDLSNLKVGFLGFNSVTQTIDLDQVANQVRQAKQKSDLLIVAFHWGAEYVFEPAPDPFHGYDPKLIGPQLIDWGADIVVGNHPHWHQTIEWYKGKPIFYALGNTVFDQEWSLETKRGILVKLHFQDKNLQKDKIEIIPVGIRNYGQAYLLKGEEKQRILDLY